MGWSLWLAAWGMLLIVLGFRFRRVEVRYTAMVLLLVAVAMIMIRLLKDADTIWRILSFMGVGLLLVGGALIYTLKFRTETPLNKVLEAVGRYSGNPDPPEDSPQ